MRITEWLIKLGGFLAFNEYDIFKNSDKISHAVACSFAEKEVSGNFEVLLGGLLAVPPPKKENSSF